MSTTRVSTIAALLASLALSAVPASAQGRGWGDGQEAQPRSGGERRRPSGGEGRQGLAGQIREHMSVVDARGNPVGTVDAVEEDRIKLTRAGSTDGEHHYLALDRVESVENDQVRISDGMTDVWGSGAK